ncbi:MAG: LamG domain-containing protein [Clostridiales bacterium]|nr:LamG domain-containing protein [Clostridiales bacterium]
MFAAVGKTVEKGMIGEMGIRDTAAIVLHALGLEQPASWTARVPSGLFKGVTAGERPVYVIPDGTREHENVATPEAGSEGYVTNFIKDKKLIAYLTFDGDITDECGAATTQGGKLYFVEGYFGQGVSLDDGYVSIPNYAPGTDSFSVSLWLKTKGVLSDPAIFSNKNWNDGRLQGYVLSVNNGGNIKFNAGNGTDRVDVEDRMPYDYTNGWVHVTLVVDRTAGEIKIAFDFGSFTTMPLPETMKDASFNAYDVLNIGQDGTGSYSADLTATVDEFMIFDGALTAEDLKALAAYYGK